MYLLGIVVFLGLMTGITALVGAPSVYLDLPSLLVVLAVLLPSLLAAGLLGDLVKGFRLMRMKENPFSILELKRIRQACLLSQRALPLAGLLGFMVGLVGMLTRLDDFKWIGTNLAMAMLVPIYALIFLFAVFPMRAKVESVMDTMEAGD